MNILLTHIILTISLLLLVGCTQTNPATTSSHNDMNKISPDRADAKPGYMQNSLDAFLKDDWEPTVTKDKEIQKKYMKKKEEEKTQSSQETYEEDKDRAFTLQEYVDKAVAYSKAKPNDYNSSNTKKLDVMPVIGK